MGDDKGNQPSLADLMAKLEAIQADIDGLKAKSSSAAESSNSGRGDSHTRDLDRPLKFQKWEFPRYDGTTDPRLFLNKCESYFRQQRTMTEERVWMASYNLDGVAQEWFIQLQDDEGTPPWGGASRTSWTCGSGPRCDPLLSSSRRSASAPARWRSTPTGSKASCSAPAVSRNTNAFSSTPGASYRRSAIPCAFTTRRH
jgi:hypothetical protein